MVGSAPTRAACAHVGLDLRWAFFSCTLWMCQAACSGVMSCLSTFTLAYQSSSCMAGQTLLIFLGVQAEGVLALALLAHHLLDPRVIDSDLGR